MYYNDFYDAPNLVSNSSSIDSTWLIVSAVLAIVGGIVAYFLFVAKKQEDYTGFYAWLHTFLNFKTFFIDTILKVLYMVSAIFITLGSFSLIGSSVASFFLMLVLGNVLLRISYEFIMLFMTLVNNSTEINKKLSEKAPKEPEAVVEKPKKKAAPKETATEEEY